MANLTTTKISTKSHKKLKEYCTKNQIPLSQVLSDFADFIVDKNIHPAHFNSIERTYDLENWQKAEGSILEKIAELRNTYVSFQRRFEQQYRRDLENIKETAFYNSKRTLNLISEGDKYFSLLSCFIEQLILTDIKAQLEHKPLSPTQQKRVENLDLSSHVQGILNSKSVNIQSIFSVSNRIVQGILK